MQRTSGIDFTTKVRVVAGAVLLIVGVLGVVGSVVDWVTITPPGSPPPGVDFEGDPFIPNESTEPFNGLEAGDGYVTLVASGLILAAGFLLVIGRKGGGLGFVSSMLLGAVAISAYRGTSSPGSVLMERTDTAGDPDPALGPLLLGIAAVTGLVAAALAVAATPRDPAVDEEAV